MSTTQAMLASIGIALTVIALAGGYVMHEARAEGRRQPVPPQNVRVVMPDGREIPLECVYAGMVDGIHRWHVAWPLGEPFESVRIGMLPGRTSVTVVARYPS